MMCTHTHPHSQRARAWAHTHNRNSCIPFIHIKILGHAKNERKILHRHILYLLSAPSFFRNGIHLNVYGALMVRHLSSHIHTSRDTNRYWATNSEETKRGSIMYMVLVQGPLSLAWYCQFAHGEQRIQRSKRQQSGMGVSHAHAREAGMESATHKQGDSSCARVYTLEPLMTFSTFI